MFYRNKGNNPVPVYNEKTGTYGILTTNDDGTTSFTEVGTTVKETPLQEGTKNDDDKLRLDLLPIRSLEEVAKVLTFGSKKYEPYNWAKGMAWSRLVGAAMRHLFAFARGEDVDPETKVSHLAHCACCVLFLLEYTFSRTEFDDRHKL